MPYNEIVELKALRSIKTNAYEKAIKLLMDAYGDDIFRFCYSMLDHKHDAQDTLQNIFIQAYNGLSSFKEQSSFRTWLYAIARNRCLDLIKKNRRMNKHLVFSEDVPEQGSTAGDSIENSQDRFVQSIIQHCLDALAPSVKCAVLLRFQSGCSYQEAAAIVQEEAGTLQARVARALPRIRLCVEEKGVTL